MSSNRETTGSAGHRRGVRYPLSVPLVVASLTGLLGLAGCGNVTSGGFGDVEVIVSADEIVDIQSAVLQGLQATEASDAAWSPALASGDSIEGTVTVRVRSFARRIGGDFEELTDGVQELTLSIQDPAPVEIARRRLSAGRYDAVETIFGRIEANITAGLVVDGIAVEGPVSVDLGLPGTVSIVALTGFDVWEDAETVIALEMQSRLWLRLVNAIAGRVELSDFRRIFRVSIRSYTGG